MRDSQGGVVGRRVIRRRQRDGRAARLADLLIRLRVERPDVYPAVICIVRSMIYGS